MTITNQKDNQLNNVHLEMITKVATVWTCVPMWLTAGKDAEIFTLQWQTCHEPTAGIAGESWKEPCQSESSLSTLQTSTATMEYWVTWADCGAAASDARTSDADALTPLITTRRHDTSTTVDSSKSCSNYWTAESSHRAHTFMKVPVDVKRLRWYW